MNDTIDRTPAPTTSSSWLRRLLLAAGTALLLLAPACLAESELPPDDSSGELADSADDLGQSDQDLSLSRSKRDYCCFNKNDVGLVTSCRGIRDYRDELGRLSALNNCQSTFSGSDWQNHELVSASCSDRPECPPPPPVPPPPPSCANGVAEGGTWSRVRPGTRCELVDYVCRNLTIVETGSHTRANCTEL